MSSSGASTGSEVRINDDEDNASNEISRQIEGAVSQIQGEFSQMRSLFLQMGRKFNNQAKSLQRMKAKTVIVTKRAATAAAARKNV